MSANPGNRQLTIQKLEEKVSELMMELEQLRFQLKTESEKLQYYQLVADFAFAWELWFDTDGSIKYCSPSCLDMTGFSANQIIASADVCDLLVYSADKERFAAFLNGALNMSLVNQMLEFRILTLTKQLRWVVMNVRGVYDKRGKYLGIRASVHDITTLKNAMGHISDLEKSREFENRNRQRLQTELELKDRELVAFLSQLSQKNDLLKKATGLLEGFSDDSDANARKTLNALNDLFKNNHSQFLNWSMVEVQIEKLYPGFLGRLQKRHPGISQNDKKLCAYIRLGLSSKEISGLLNIASKSVEVARVRLRKKLNISSKIRLFNYLVSM